MEATELPLYLQSAQDFRIFLDEQFAGLTTVQIGERFASSELLFVKAQHWAGGFPNIRLNPKKSNELGRDILSDLNTEGVQLLGESKYSLGGVEEFDSILSKWKQVEYELRGDAEETLFGRPDGDSRMPQYVIVSGSDIAGIVRRYRNQPGRGCRDFFDDLEQQRRINYYGIADVYKWLRETYLRQHGIPSDFRLTSPHEWVKVGSSYLGAVAGSELVKLIDSHGESLFFENIRGWLGEKSQVNSTIIDTVKSEPEKFLERNNGVTFRAKGVKRRENTLTISQGNIINGCQTTMALWEARPTSDQLFVQVKVVDAEEQEDAWKIAESANLQNQVTLLELKLAQHLRPQLVARHASRLGRSLKLVEPNNLEGVLAAVGSSDADYHFARSIFLGLFSRQPNNLFADNYDRLRGGLIAAFYGKSAQAENKLFECVFDLMEEGREAVSDAAKALAGNQDAEVFARVFEEGGTKYRALIILLAACGLLRIDLSAREENDVAEASRIDHFIDRLSNALHSETDEFRRVCKFALHTIFSDVMRDAEDDRKMKQYLAKRMENASFNRLYQNLVRALDLL